MRIALAVLAIWPLLGGIVHAAPPGTPTPEPTEPPEMRCPSVRISLDDPISSSSARQGDVFWFTNVDPIVIDGKVAVDAKRGSGIGIISYVEHAQRGGHAGILVLDPRYFRTTDGRDVHVEIDGDNNSGYSVGKSRNAPGYFGFIPGAGIALSAYAAAHRGQDVSVPAGTIFTVFVGDEEKIAVCRYPGESSRARRQQRAPAASGTTPP